MVADRARIRTCTRRAVLLGTAEVLVLSALAGRMYQLQVLEADRYKLLAERNRINAHPLLPQRGVLLDRFGIPLAGNCSSSTVVLRPDQIQDPAASLRKLATHISLIPGDVVLMIVRTTRPRRFATLAVID